jgi:peptidoglycan-N-acetylglucosamine deacetylase
VLLAALGITAGLLLSQRGGETTSATTRERITTRAPHVHEPRRRTAAGAALDRLIRVGLPLYCGGRRGHDVALTFDDGPGVYTHLALRILRAAHARATFFLVGRNIATWSRFLHPELLLGGLGDHTWTHAYLPALTAAATRSQIADTQRAIERVSGSRVRLFRPPYGVRTRASDAAARSLGMVDILWSVDSLDWKGADWQQIAANVVRGVRAGSIVLMHENRGQTIRALKFLLLPELRARRWRLVSVAQLLTVDPPSRRQLGAGLAGCVGARLGDRSGRG